MEPFLLSTRVLSLVLRDRDLLSSISYWLSKSATRLLIYSEPLSAGGYPPCVFGAKTLHGTLSVLNPSRLLVLPYEPCDLGFGVAADLL